LKRSQFFNENYKVLYVLISLVYGFGLVLPLLENDAAQHATMAMRMYLENDYWNLYRGTDAYLDKPHLHFWLSAFAFKLFGVNHVAYRIPSLLFTMVGALSVYRLGYHWYQRKTGHIAALVFLTSQAIFLGNHDVRTDAILVGGVAFGIWKAILYLDNGRWKDSTLGAFGIAVGFMAKGPLAVVIALICLGVYVIHKKKYRQLFSYKLLVGISMFFLFISPVLYAYYVQFDLHPEIVVNGVNKISGVRFILWDQIFNRHLGAGFTRINTDFTFFFHTLLWAFLPWSILFYVALGNKFREWIKNKETQHTEIVTSLGVLLVLIAMSFSKSKLPHYVNALFPLMSILVAAYLTSLHQISIKKIWYRWQFGMVLVVLVALTSLVFWSFPQVDIWKIVSILLLACLVALVTFYSENLVSKIVVVSVGAAIVINAILNLQFYPNLAKYQGGYAASEYLNEQKISTNDVLRLDKKYNWPLDFYTQEIVNSVSMAELKNSSFHGNWLFFYDSELDVLKDQGVAWEQLKSFDHYRVTRLKWSFLHPKKRHKTLGKIYLVKLK